MGDPFQNLQNSPWQLEIVRVVIALVIPIFHHFFLAKYYQNQGKYFSMTCFNQIRIINFTKAIAFPIVHNVRLSLLPSFQKGWGGFRGSQFLERVCWEQVGWHFSRGLQFLHNKLKSELFNNKKSLRPKSFFSVITENLNWKILTENVVTFKRWDGAKNE